MKKFTNLIRSKYYFKFIIFIILFALLSYMAFLLDKSIQNSNYSSIFNFSQNFIQDFLMMMVAAIITMVTITFSTIMVVLTLYSGQFSPRTLNDFLQRKVPLNILGIFIGITVYALLSLVLTESYASYLFPNIGLFSFLLFITSIILFAYYIHYVAKSVQVNVYIDKMVKKAVKKIEAYQEKIKEDPMIQLERNDEDAEKEFNLEYKSKHTGYLIDINKEKIVKYLKEHDLSISVNIPINQHVYEDDILFKYQGETHDFDDDIIDQCFIISDEIGSLSAYREQTMKLVEIAVRALSPGTNDPFTAISCIEQLGFVFMKLSDTYYSLYYHDDNGKERLMIRTLNYDDLLYDHFYQIYHYGKNDLTIISNILKSFAKIASKSNYEMKHSLWSFSLYVLKDIQLKDLHDLDFREINLSLKDLAIACKKKKDYQELIKEIK